MIAAAAVSTCILSERYGLLAAAVLGLCPTAWLWWPPKGSGKPVSVYVEQAADKWQVVRKDSKGVKHKGPRRASERAALEDKAAIARAAPEDQLAVIDGLRTEADAPALKRSLQQAAQGLPMASTPAKVQKRTCAGTVSKDTPSRTPRTAAGSRNVAMKWFQAVLNFWSDRKRAPLHCSSTSRGSGKLEAHENNLAVQLARYRKRDLSGPKYATTRKALADIKELEEAAREWTQAEAPVLAAEQRLQAEHEAWCRGQRREPEPRPLLQRRAGRHAYPGLLNLGLTCYLGSIVQCLLHCGAARSALLGQPAAAPPHAMTTLPLALHALAVACVDGVAVPVGAGLRPDFRARVDLYSPHVLMDTCAEASGFALGRNYDAVEALGILFRGVAPLRHLFHASSALTVEDIVCLHPFSDASDAWGGLGPFIVDDLTKCVDMSDVGNGPHRSLKSFTCCNKDVQCEREGAMLVCG